jgi:hypothetical protein
MWRSLPARLGTAEKHAQARQLGAHRRELYFEGNEPCLRFRSASVRRLVAFARRHAASYRRAEPSLESLPL